LTSGTSNIGFRGAAMNFVLVLQEQRQSLRGGQAVQAQRLRFGSNLLWAAYGNAGDGSCTRVGATCTTNGLGEDQWTLGYSYSFAKRTDVYAAVYRVNNDRSASYGVFPPAATVAPGGDTFSYCLGILHSFLFLRRPRLIVRLRFWRIPMRSFREVCLSK
jgi:hypothetical protein